MKKRVLKTKVFQVFRDAFDAKGNRIPKGKRKFRTLCIGEVVFAKNANFDINDDARDIREEIWDAFNWTCWGCSNRRNMWLAAVRKGMKSPSGWFRFYPYTTARGYCNGDIFFRIGTDVCVATSCGWETVGTYAEAEAIIKENMRY